MAVVDVLPQLAPTPSQRAAPPVPQQTPRDPSPLFCRLFLVCWCGILFFYGLSASQLWKTESLRAIIAAEYLRSGNWIVPTLYGEPLFTKPPGMYAAIALCSLIFGQVTELSARLPSALAATLTILMLYGYFARAFGRRGGLVIAVLTPMSALWLDKATAAEIDMMQVMWVTGSILCLLRAIEESGAWSVERGACFPRTHRSSLFTLHSSPFTLPWWLAALLCVAGGTLTKWTAPAFFYATAIPLLWWRAQLRLLLGWRHLVAAGLGASICFAWIGAAVALEGWDVFYQTVRREALQRMVPDYAPATDAWYVFLCHPLRLWLTNLPWSLVALIACRPGFGKLLDQRGRLVWQAMHCWIWPNMVIWSLMLDHKPRHSFPFFPAFAGLAALVWLAWLDGRLRWNWRVEPRRILTIAVICWLTVKLVFVQTDAGRHDNRDPKGKGAIVAALMPSAPFCICSGSRTKASCSTMAAPCVA